jgi:hypothetical protein
VGYNDQREVCYRAKDAEFKLLSQHDVCVFIAGAVDQEVYGLIDDRGPREDEDAFFSTEELSVYLSYLPPGTTSHEQAVIGDEVYYPADESVVRDGSRRARVISACMCLLSVLGSIYV